MNRNKSYLSYSLIIVTLCELAYLLGMNAYTLASEPEPSATPTVTPNVVEMNYEAEPTIDPLTPAPRKPTPEPTNTPEWASPCEYDDGEFRCLARFRRSCVSDKATWITQIVACEVVQNRTTQDGFQDTIRRVLLQPNEFGGYNAKVHPRAGDELVAEFAIRSFAEALRGDFTHRYTPLTGVYLEYSSDLKYCKVYDKNWKILCDTSQFE